jgi:hypothetical protein
MSDRPRARTIALEVLVDDEWHRVAEKNIDSPQQGNPFKTMMKTATAPLRVVQEVGVDHE